MTQSKRFLFTMVCIAINFIIFTIALFSGIDPISCGTGLSLLNAPLYAYIFGETIRKSEKTKLENE